MSDATTGGASATRARRALWLAWRTLTATALVVGVGLAALMLLPAALGYERYVITGDSMSGSIDRGSLVFEEVVPVAELERGDVITYEPPGEASAMGLVTHRIVDAGTDDRGETWFRTKGDANESADPWRFTLDAATQARVAFHVPYVGYAYAALSLKELRMLVIGGPALLIALLLVAGLWRQAGEEARREASIADADEAAEEPVSAPPDEGSALALARNP
jgi:signal peptidase